MAKGSNVELLQEFLGTCKPPLEGWSVDLVGTLELVDDHLTVALNVEGCALAEVLDCRLEAQDESFVFSLIVGDVVPNVRRAPP